MGKEERRGVVPCCRSPTCEDDVDVADSIGVCRHNELVGKCVCYLPAYDYMTL